MPYAGSGRNAMKTEVEVLTESAKVLEKQANTISETHTVNGAWIGSRSERKEFFKIGNLAKRLLEMASGKKS